MPLYRGLQRHYKAHMWLLREKKKKYISCSGEKHGGSLCGRKNENKCAPFYTMNQVSLLIHSAAALYTPTQAHSCKNGFLKDDCTPASIPEFKSTTYHLWLLTRRVKSTELTQNPKIHKCLMINQLMVKMFQSGFSTKNWERSCSFSYRRGVQDTSVENLSVIFRCHLFCLPTPGYRRGEQQHVSISKNKVVCMWRSKPIILGA